MRGSPRCCHASQQLRQCAPPHDCSPARMVLVRPRAPRNRPRRRWVPERMSRKPCTESRSARRVQLSRTTSGCACRTLSDVPRPLTGHVPRTCERPSVAALQRVCARVQRNGERHGRAQKCHRGESSGGAARRPLRKNGWPCSATCIARSPSTSDTSEDAGGDREGGRSCFGNAPMALPVLDGRAGRSIDRPRHGRAVGLMLRRAYRPDVASCDAVHSLPPARRIC